MSGSHIIALTSEQMVFTWGDGRRGQLGHGELETWRSTPHCVEALKVSFFFRIPVENHNLSVIWDPKINHINQKFL